MSEYNYDRDYLTTLPLLYEQANLCSDGTWNKYNNDIGDTLLKLIASSSHTVDYYFRKFLTALVLPNDNWNQKSLIWELTGYKPNYLRADYLMVQLYWPDCGLKSYTPLYQYTPFRLTADGKEYTFLCAQDYIIPPFTTRANIRLINGELRTIDQDYTQVVDNKIKLSDDDLDYDLVTVVISSTKWTQVRNVFYSPKTDRIYSVHKEEDGTYLYLHKSWQDYVDSYDTSFKIYYVLSKFDFDIYTDECLTVEFETELLTLDGDDVSQFYKIIPLINSDEAFDVSNLMPSTTEGNRAITVLDFESNAALFPGIVTSKAYDWNTPEVCKEPFEVDLIACDSKGNLTTHMQQVLKDYLESICSPLLTVKVIPPQFVKQDLLVLLDIGDFRGTLTELELKKEVIWALEDFYKIGNLPPGRVVNTMELNSLLLHVDTRIYFATVSFVNALVRSPFLIPILGEVSVITSAEAFTKYDFGSGFGNGYIDPYPVDHFMYIDIFRNIGFLQKEDIEAKFLFPIDKLPVQSFEKAFVAESLVTHVPAGDFGCSDYFIHVLSLDKEESNTYLFVFETDGTSVLGKLDNHVDDTVRAQLVFERDDLTTYTVDLDLILGVTDTDLESVKVALAEQFNNIDGLIDLYGNPLVITSDDIQILSEEEPVYGNGTLLRGEVNVNEYRLILSDSGVSSDTQVSPDSTFDRGLIVSDSVTSGESAAVPAARVVRNLYTTDSGISSELSVKAGPNAYSYVDTGTVTERQFVYIPYNGIVFNELIRISESAAVKKVEFIVREYVKHSYVDCPEMGYSCSDARLVSDPLAYGKMNFVADVNLVVSDITTEFVPTKPDLYSEDDSFGTEYYVREKNGNALHWYLVNTSEIDHMDVDGERVPVGGTYEIGYCIKVGFKLPRDIGIYVETDVQTSRGFIYSSELLVSDVYVLGN